MEPVTSPFFKGKGHFSSKHLGYSESISLIVRPVTWAMTSTGIPSDFILRAQVPPQSAC